MSSSKEPFGPGPKEPLAPHDPAKVEAGADRVRAGGSSGVTHPERADRSALPPALAADLRRISAASGDEIGA